MEEETTITSSKEYTNDNIFGLFDVGTQNEIKSSNIEIELEAFLKEKFNNHLILLTEGNYAITKRPLLVLFHQFNQHYNELAEWIHLLHKLAAKFTPDSMQFAIADFEDLPIFHTSWEDMDYFGFDAEMPPYVYAVDSFNRQFQYEGKVTFDDLAEYAKQLVDNKLWRTQAVPEETENNAFLNIKKVVASNLEKSILECDKDILLTFHSNHWPTYDYNLFGIPKELLDDSDNLIFYNYNAQENYLPLEFKIRDLPTSVFIPRHAKSKRLVFTFETLYTSCHVYQEFRKFIARNVTNELKLYERDGYLKDFEALKQKKLVNFLKENYDGKIQVLSSRNHYGIQRPLLVLYHQFNDNFFELKEWIDLLFEMTQNVSKSICFALADFDSLSLFYTCLNKLNLFGVDITIPPFAFAIDSCNHEFQYDGPITLDALTKYCEQLANNSLYKSESIPDELENEGILKTVVADNFWTITYNHDKDVLITFYKDSFGWEDTINHVIEELECDLDKLAFYKYNVAANYLPLELQITEFPTSMLIPSYDRCKKEFFNHLDYLVYDNFTHPYWEELIKFLAANVSTELTCYHRNGKRREKKDIRADSEEKIGA